MWRSIALMSAEPWLGGIGATVRSVALMSPDESLRLSSPPLLRSTERPIAPILPRGLRLAARLGRARAISEESRADVSPPLLLLAHHLDHTRRHVADVAEHVRRRELHAVHGVLAGIDLHARFRRVGKALLDA